MGRRGACERSRSSLQFTETSAAETERLIAAVWRVLEEHALESPTVDVRSSRIGFFYISLNFCSAEDCALVMANLPRVEALLAGGIDTIPTGMD
jgi:hypothetical protein